MGWNHWQTRLFSASSRRSPYILSNIFLTDPSHVNPGTCFVLLWKHPKLEKVGLNEREIPPPFSDCHSPHLSSTAIGPYRILPYLYKPRCFTDPVNPYHQWPSNLKCSIPKMFNSQLIHHPLAYSLISQTCVVLPGRSRKQQTPHPPSAVCWPENTFSSVGPQKAQPEIHPFFFTCKISEFLAVVTGDLRLAWAGAYTAPAHNRPMHLPPRSPKTSRGYPPQAAIRTALELSIDFLPCNNTLVQ